MVLNTERPDCADAARTSRAEGKAGVSGKVQSGNDASSSLRLGLKYYQMCTESRLEAVRVNIRH
jgi:hypothetical protein